MIGDLEIKSRPGATASQKQRLIWIYTVCRSSNSAVVSNLPRQTVEANLRRRASNAAAGLEQKKVTFQIAAI